MGRWAGVFSRGPGELPGSGSPDFRSNQIPTSRPSRTKSTVLADLASMYRSEEELVAFPVRTGRAWEPAVWCEYSSGGPFDHHQFSGPL
jgi:hypothetical protein